MITRQQAIQFYTALVNAAPMAYRAEFKELLDELILESREYNKNRPAELVAAEVMARQTGTLFRNSVTKIPDTSWEQGMFLTGGHTFHDYSKARDFVGKYWPEGVEWLTDSVN